MPSPTGSVPALSAASATIFSIGIVFLGYWGLYEPTMARRRHLRVRVRADRFRLPRARAVDGDESRRTGKQRCRDSHRAASVFGGCAGIWLAVAISVIF